MTKIETWRTKCRICESPVYYYPAKLLLESIELMDFATEKVTIKTVSCTCTGEKQNTKHTLDYIFTNDFEKQ